MSNDLAAKLQSLGLGQSPEEFVEALEPNVKTRVKALQGLQEAKEVHEAQYRKEMAELDAKYEKLYAPLYAERTEIVSGAKAMEGSVGEDAGIPNFWLTVLCKCEQSRSFINEKDADVLRYVTDIQSENMTEDGTPQGFKLKFFFAKNPYFTNEVLEKTYFMLPDSDVVLEKAEGTKIAWVPGKDVTVKLMKKKPKKGAKPSGKPEMKTEKVESFFNFFDPPKVPEDEEDEMDDDAMDELQATIEADYELGALIHEKLVPDAAAWYTGQAAEEEDEMGYEFEEGEDDDEEADPSSAVQPAGGAPGAPAAPPTECKQQ